MNNKKSSFFYDAINNKISKKNYPQESESNISNGECCSFCWKNYGTKKGLSKNIMNLFLLGSFLGYFTLQSAMAKPFFGFFGSKPTTQQSLKKSIKNIKNLSPIPSSSSDSDSGFTKIDHQSYNLLSKSRSSSVLSFYEEENDPNLLLRNLDQLTGNSKNNAQNPLNKLSVKESMTFSIKAPPTLVRPNNLPFGKNILEKKIKSKPKSRKSSNGLLSSSHFSRDGENYGESLSGAKKNAEEFFPRYTQDVPLRRFNLDDLSLNESIIISCYSDGSLEHKEKKLNKKPAGSVVSHVSSEDIAENNPYKALRDIVATSKMTRKTSLDDSIQQLDGLNNMLHDFYHNLPSFLEKSIYGSGESVFSEPKKPLVTMPASRLFQRLSSLSTRISSLEREEVFSDNNDKTSLLSIKKENYSYPKSGKKYNIDVLGGVSPSLSMREILEARFKKSSEERKKIFQQKKEDLEKRILEKKNR